MGDYKKLVESLRLCQKDDGCESCAYKEDLLRSCCWIKAMSDAADAIEALQAKVDKQDVEITELLSVITKKDEGIEALQAELPKLGKWIHLDDADEYIAGFRDGHDQGYAAGYEDARKEIEDAACVRCGECRYFNRRMGECKKHGGRCTKECFCPMGKRRLFKCLFSK